MSALLTRHNLIGGGTLFMKTYRKERKDVFLATNPNDIFYLNTVLHFELEQKKKAKRSFGHKIRQAVYKKHDGKCKYCQSVNELQIHHVVPYSQGGGNKNNLELVCGGCHDKIHDKC